MSNIARRCILILGVHRSGSSALSGVLDRMGIDLGKAIAPPSYDNPKGFYENTRVQALNNKLLAELKITWDYTGLINGDWWKHLSISKYRSEAIEIIEEEFKGQSLFAIKDPRICYLFPFWENIFDSLNITIQCIVMLRHPEEVAASLEKRNQFSYTKSHLLYLSHLFCIEKYRQGYNTSFVKYDELLDNPLQIVQQLDRELNLNRSKENISTERFDDFISKGLRNHHFSDTTLINKPFLSHIASSYQTFFTLPREKSTIEQITLLSAQHEKFLNAFGNGLEEGNRYTTSILINFGEGFQEVEKLSAIIKADQHLWDISEWCDEKTIHAIKLIPISSAGFVNLEPSLSLKTAQISSNANFVKDDTYYFEDKHSEIIFQFQAPQKLDDCTLLLSYDYIIPSVDFSLNESLRELNQLKTSFSYRLGWILTSPFRLIYYLFHLFRADRVSQIIPLIKSVLKNPMGLLKSVQPQHFKTLKNALLTEPPDVIVKNIIKLIRKNN